MFIYVAIIFNTFFLQLVSLIFLMVFCGMLYNEVKVGHSDVHVCTQPLEMEYKLLDHVGKMVAGMLLTLSIVPCTLTQDQW